MDELLKRLAEVSGWSIPEDRMREIASIYAGTMDDTRPLRDLDLGFTVPAILYKASE